LGCTYSILFFQNEVKAQTVVETVVDEILKAPITTISTEASIATIDINKGILLITSPLTCKPCIIEMATHFEIPVVFLLNKELNGARVWYNYLKSNDLKNDCYFIVYQKEIVLESPMLLFCHDGKIYSETYESIFNIRHKKKKIKQIKKILTSDP